MITGVCDDVFCVITRVRLDLQACVLCDRLNMSTCFALSLGYVYRGITRLFYILWPHSTVIYVDIYFVACTKQWIALHTHVLCEVW